MCVFQGFCPISPPGEGGEGRKVVKFVFSVFLYPMWQGLAIKTKIDFRSYHEVEEMLAHFTQIALREKKPQKCKKDPKTPRQMKFSHFFFIFRFTFPQRLWVPNLVILIQLWRNFTFQGPKSPKKTLKRPQKLLFQIFSSYFNFYCHRGYVYRIWWS